MTALQFDLDTVLDTLAEQGWIVIPQALPAELTANLRRACLQVWDEGRFHEAATGRADGQARRAEIRSDSVLWLDQVAELPAVAAYNAAMDEIMRAVNRGLYLGLAELESHFAVYPEGAFYKKHLDRFQDDDARALTTVFYLNENWPAGAGGQIRLYLDQDCQQFIDVEPEAGTLVLFLSDRFWHEVLPAKRQRLSVTGWYRRQGGSLPW
ncbi:2OG-Fe(II) oxygenase [Chromobacterium phragmitis]|uniref:2OG-Fe(II) oxygenase n=1 Tax=Chromobacterium amazonense TaxID=1382803 RepID=UPI000583B142|nr:2OG-Fe(II) oxygenase [Chromobacterium amazonense]KIA82136.1 2OG-Fe(II) oxygenase [Chromobacterium piscinae]MBM2883066.1 2OG-Fe(II) oxygenase [Chromobacterium amazonense]MDE1711972.1 2OG-Fe(II) oxygenase [Chromobacterium amazonense]